MLYLRAKNCLGQSLLEVTIVIGLVVIVLTAVASLVIHGLEVSQAAQIQTQAAKLARQGIEIVRNIRDTQGTVCGPTPLTKWDTTFWGGPCTTSTCYYKITQPASTCLGVGTTNPWLNNTSSSTDYEAIGTQFSRQIKVDPISGNPNQVMVTSTVFWADYSGTHSTSVVTILANI